MTARPPAHERDSEIVYYKLGRNGKAYPRRHTLEEAKKLAEIIAYDVDIVGYNAFGKVVEVVGP